MRAAMFGGGAALVGGLGFLVWTQLVAAPPPRIGTSASASADAGPAPSITADPNATTSARPPVVAAPLPAWMTYVRDGQQAIAAGDLKQATRLFKDAFDKGGGHGVPRTLIEHVAVAASNGGTGVAGPAGSRGSRGRAPTTSPRPRSGPCRRGAPRSWWGPRARW